MSKSILIADDSAQMRLMARKVVESMPGFAVCGEAVDGFEALEKTRQLAPDLVILDLAMPRMNGFEAARALRASGSRVPIILFTLHADVVSPVQASAAGIDAVVAKIGGCEALSSQVERLLPAA